MGKTALKVGAVIATGLVAAGGAAIALGKKVGDTADRLLDLSSITGMSTSEIQKWQNASVIAGTSTEAMTNASEKLTQTMDTMAAGTGKAAEAAGALGFSYKQLSGMDADERMNSMITALQGVEDKTERAKIGTDLFGKKWAEIAPIVDLGVQGLKDAKDNAIVFDEESLIAANKFRIVMDSAKKGLSNLALQIGIGLMPMLLTMGNYLTKHMPQIKAKIKEVTAAVSDFIAGIVEWSQSEKVKEWADKTKKALTKFKTEAEKVLGYLIEVAKDIIKNWDLIGPVLAGILAGFIAFKVITGILKAITIAQVALNSVMNLNPMAKIIIVIGLLVAAGMLLYKNWDKIKAKASEVWSSIKSTVTNVIEGIKTKIGEMIKVGENIARGLWQGLQNSAAWLKSKVVGWIKQVIPDPILKALGLSSSSKVIDLSIESRSHLANGTDFWKGGLSWVGEDGPELLNLPRGSQVIPNSKAMEMASFSQKVKHEGTIIHEFRTNDKAVVARIAQTYNEDNRRLPTRISTIPIQA